MGSVLRVRMKGAKRFPWFEAVAFLLILLLALGSNLSAAANSI